MSSTWEKTRVRHLKVINATAEEEEQPTELHITKNSKTGISVDFPPHVSCSPTRVCMGDPSTDSAPCYALSGFMTYNAAVRKHAQNQALVDRLSTADYGEVRKVVDTLYGALPRKLDWLRWNGAGDLTLGSVRVINAFLVRHGDVRSWVISRKPAMIAKLKDVKPLFLLISIDHSTPNRVADALREQAQRFEKAKARIAYVRTSEADTPPKDAFVVFNKHTGGNKYGWVHRRVCPATLPEGPHEKACASCRKCFT